MPRDASRLIRSAGELGGPLEDAGQEIWDAPKLELCALGRAARWGVGKDDDLRGAAAGVLIDALTCAETVSGWVRPDWRDGIAANEGAYRKWLGESRGGSEILARVDRGRLERLGAEANAVVAKRRAAQDGLATDRFRGELVERLTLATQSIERVPVDHRVEARGIRAVLKRLRDRAGDVRSRTDLEEVAELSEDPIRQAGALRARIDEERESEARIAQVEKDRGVEARRQEARIKSQAKEAAAQGARQKKANLKALGKMRSALVSLRGRKKTTSPTEVLDRLMRIRVVEDYIEERTELLPVNPLGELVAKIRNQEIEPVRTTVRYRWIRTRDGRLWWPKDFAQWTDQGTKEALGAAIAEIDSYAEAIRSGAVGIAPIALTALGTGQL
jgi:hypothetical protein